MFNTRLPLFPTEKEEFPAPQHLKILTGDDANQLATFLAQLNTIAKNNSDAENGYRIASLRKFLRKLTSDQSNHYFPLIMLNILQHANQNVELTRALAPEIILHLKNIHRAKNLMKIMSLIFELNDLHLINVLGDTMWDLLEKKTPQYIAMRLQTFLEKNAENSHSNFIKYILSRYIDLIHTENTETIKSKKSNFHYFITDESLDKKNKILILETYLNEYKTDAIKYLLSPDRRRKPVVAREMEAQVDIFVHAILNCNFSKRNKKMLLAYYFTLYFNKETILTNIHYTFRKYNFPKDITFLKSAFALKKKSDNKKEIEEFYNKTLALFGNDEQTTKRRKVDDYTNLIDLTNTPDPSISQTSTGLYSDDILNTYLLSFPNVEIQTNQALNPEDNNSNLFLYVEPLLQQTAELMTTEISTTNLEDSLINDKGKEEAEETDIKNPASPVPLKTSISEHHATLWWPAEEKNDTSFLENHKSDWSFDF